MDAAPPPNDVHNNFGTKPTGTADVDDDRSPRERRPPAASAIECGRGRGRDRRSFLHGLHDVLSEHRDSLCISWLSHGRGFIITDKPKFEREILSTFLPNTKYASFTRRLKRWKFVRVTSGIEIGSYYHTHFQRGKPHLIHLINTNDAPLQANVLAAHSGFPITGSTAGGSVPTTSAMIAASDPSVAAAHSKLCVEVGQVGNATSLFDRRRASYCSDVSSNQDTPDDVRNFPEMMRQISKVKRQQSIASKRKREEDASPRPGTGDESNGNCESTVASGFAMVAMQQQPPPGDGVMMSQFCSQRPPYWDNEHFLSMMQQGERNNPFAVMHQNESHSTFNVMQRNGRSNASSNMMQPNDANESTWNSSVAASNMVWNTMNALNNDDNRCFDSTERWHQQQLPPPSDPSMPVGMPQHAQATMYEDHLLSGMNHDWMTMKQQREQQQQRQQGSGDGSGWDAAAPSADDNAAAGSWRDDWC